MKIADKIRKTATNNVVVPVQFTLSLHHSYLYIGGTNYTSICWSQIKYLQVEFDELLDKIMRGGKSIETEGLKFSFQRRARSDLYAPGPLFLFGGSLPESESEYVQKLVELKEKGWTINHKAIKHHRVPLPPE